MKYYINPCITANHQPMVEFRTALRPELFNNFVILSFVDRMNIIGNSSDIEVIQPIQNYDPKQTYNFDQLIRDRVLELINISNQKNVPIQLMWSGGIDSTSIYCALKMHMTNPDQLVILGNKKSIEGYPKLYREIVSKHRFIDITVDRFYENCNRLTSGNSVTVTGELADQLFAAEPINGRFKYLIDWETEPWQAVLNPKTTQCHDQVENYINKFPRPINLARDFARSIKFNLLYQAIQARMSLRIEGAIVNQNFFHFYDTANFNYYALGLSNEELGSVTDDSPQIKLPLKRLILEYTQDQDYYNTKCKTGAPWSNNNAHLQASIIDTEWNKTQFESDYLDHIVDQPGKNLTVSSGKIPETHNDFSQIRLLVDWCIYSFSDTQARDQINQSSNTIEKFVLVCGFELNKTQVKDNFFVYTGNMSSYTVHTDSYGVLILTNTDNLIVPAQPIHLVGDQSFVPYSIEIQSSLLPAQLGDLNSYEIINPKTFNFNNE
jgi:hypothetical protein